ncbi:MAG TPA: hypothetical protein VFX49_21950 [Chloroflexota bacterium]|nr:hypothetical protein [Chloroflexota bacterium]
MSRRRIHIVILVAALLTAATTPVALAHGGATGAQDVLQDNLALVFLLAIVLIGAGVLAWVLLSPQPAAENDPPSEPPPGDGPAA